MSALPKGIIKTKEGIHVLKHDTHLSRWIEIHQRLNVAEDEIMRYFAKYIPKDGVVVDAGASLGDHTCTYARLVGENGMVYAFEPNPLPYQALALNFKDARNVQVIACGLSDRAERAIVHQEDNVGASHLATLPIESEDGVRCVSLDETLGSIQRLDFIHLDVEGMELNALMGARELLARFKPVIALEINVGHLKRLKIPQSAIWEFLIGVGYRVEEVDPDINPATSEQRDVFAIPL